MVQEYALASPGYWKLDKFKNASYFQTPVPGPHPRVFLVRSWTQLQR